MRIDDQLFKFFLNTQPNYKERKDIYTVISIYYLLYKNNICDKSRLMPFDTCSEGLYSSEWHKSITAKGLIKDNKERKFSKDAQKVLNNIRTTTLKSSREFDIGMRNLLIGSAAVAYLEDNVFTAKDSESLKEEKFNKIFAFLKGMYKVYNKNLKNIMSAKELSDDGLQRKKN